MDMVGVANFLVHLSPAEKKPSGSPAHNSYNGNNTSGGLAQYLKTQISHEYTVRITGDSLDRSYQVIKAKHNTTMNHIDNAQCHTIRVKTKKEVY